MPTYSLSPFIKLCMSDTGDQISEVQKKINSSDGYDYYRTLKSAIKGHIAGQASEDIGSILEGGASSSERTYNKSAYAVFAKNLENRNTSQQFQSSQRNMSFSNLESR